MRKVEKFFRSRIFINGLLTFVFLVVTYMLCMNYKSTVRNADQLYAQYYATYEIEEDVYDFYASDNTIKNVLDLYIACRYDEAFQKLVALSQDHIDTNTVNFLYGQIYMTQNNFTAADTAFKSVIYDNNNPYTLEAHWYRGLCLLKSNDYDRAIEEFELLSENNSSYQKDAKDILSCVRNYNKVS